MENCWKEIDTLNDWLVFFEVKNTFSETIFENYLEKSLLRVVITKTNLWEGAKNKKVWGRAQIIKRPEKVQLPNGVQNTYSLKDIW